MKISEEIKPPQKQETILKKSLLSIPPPRLILYGFIIGIIPIFLTFFLSSHSIEEEKVRCFLLQEKIEKLESLLNSQSHNRNTIQIYHNKEPFYLNKTLGTYTPLKQEIERLDRLQKYEAMPDTHIQYKRSSYLKNGENRFTFVESAVTIFPLFKETTETQNKPVELDESDLYQVLEYIEGEDQLKIRPHLLVLDGYLDRKKGYDQEVWSLSFKLLKRIYTTPILSPSRHTGK